MNEDYGGKGQIREEGRQKEGGRAFLVLLFVYVPIGFSGGWVWAVWRSGSM